MIGWKRVYNFCGVVRVLEPGGFALNLKYLHLFTGKDGRVGGSWGK